ncbi:HD domain-containing phosphohydrolase [Candidatus Omnitrophota bacterium]
MLKINIIVLFIGVMLGLNIARLFVRRMSFSKEDVDEKTPFVPPPHIVQSSSAQTESEAEPKVEDPTVLEKKILYEEELMRLLKIEQEISSKLQIGEIARIIVENAIKIFNAEKCALLLYDTETKELRLAYSIGISERDMQKTHVRLGEGISGRTAENNEMLILNNLEKEAGLSNDDCEYYYSGPLVSAPLSIKGIVAGVINIDRKKTGAPFDNDDVRFLRGLAIQAAIAIQNARLYEEVQEGYLRTITALAQALDAKDPYTHMHSENVTRYSVAIAEEMSLPLSEIEKIRRGGLLHDIGKIGIKDDILTKPGKLTDEEFEQIKTHPAKGEGILRSLPFLQDVAEIVRHHHERYGGGGYPDKLKGYQIEQGAKIMAVADAFDAMTSDRPYRKALSLEKATDELKRNSGSQFDPGVVDAFLKVLERNPKILETPA